jgi:hypothetical protein
MSAPAPLFSRGQALFMLGAIWLSVCMALIGINWALIAPMNFRDPDDALRLVQVRDLLAGQSWFDLTQHRIFPPQGVPMHWSRLADLPVAGLILLLDPLLGRALAEHVTLVAAPLLELGALFALAYAFSRRMGLGRGIALIAATMLATSLSILIQFAPLRIDHHGLQIVFGALAAWALVGTARRDGRNGLIAGLAMAADMQISIEGLPCAVAIGAIYALRHLLDGDRWRDLRAYLAALALGSALFLFGTHDPAAALIPWCDAMSPAYLGPLVLASAATITTGQLLPARGRLERALPLALGGIAGGAAFLLASRQCLAGPFETLDPLVYKQWYLAVREGLPIWDQRADLGAMILLPSLLGLAGSVIGWRAARGNADARLAWAGLIMLLLFAFLTSLNVMRAMSVAHFLSLPGNAMLLAALLRAAQRLPTMPVRVVVSAGTVVMTPFGAAATTTAALDSPSNASAPAEPAAPVADRFQCTTQVTLRGLDALPPALVFTPLDIGAHILVYTHHSVVGTGHHRNVGGMKAVVAGLLAPPARARAIVAGTGARYLAYCAGENEVNRYAREQPGSLIATLLKGQRPDWLEPVPLRPGESIRLFRIVPPSA